MNVFRLKKKISLLKIPKGYFTLKIKKTIKQENNKGKKFRNIHCSFYYKHCRTRIPKTKFKITGGGGENRRVDQNKTSDGQKNGWDSLHAKGLALTFNSFNFFILIRLIFFCMYLGLLIYSIIYTSLI